MDVLAHRLGEQNLLLGNVPDPAVELIGRQHLHGDVGNEDFAGSGRVLMEKLLQERRFAAARAPYDAERLTFSSVKLIFFKLSIVEVG